MLKFCIISDNLLYEALVLKAIFAVTKRCKLEYEIVDLNSLNFNLSATRIFFVDLDNKNIVSTILKYIHQNDFVIGFTHYEERTMMLLQQHVHLDYHLKKSECYGNKLETILERSIDNCLNKAGNVILKENDTIFQIPKNDILYVTHFFNSVIIDAKTSEGGKYQYILNVSKEKIINQLKEDFIEINPNLIVNKKQYDLDCKTHKILKKHKFYSKDYKEKILKDYAKGHTIKELSELYEPSISTIHRWLKEEKMEKEILLLRDKANKFDEIEIVVRR